MPLRLFVRETSSVMRMFFCSPAFLLGDSLGGFLALAPTALLLAIGSLPLRVPVPTPYAARSSANPSRSVAPLNPADGAS